jgi:molybdate/tungstate transport system substrate-binding protein
LITTSLTGCVDDSDIHELIELKVFHAGSLSGPFEEIEHYFENEHKYIDVQREAAGSADTIRKVTDIGKVADVVGSAAYTDHSAYKNDINKTNWYEIFQKSDVNFGFSNPNADPCGYRALMLIQLSELHYSQPTLFEDLVVSHTDIDISETNGNYTISAPENLNPDDTVMIRPKETDLMAQLESGDLDYLLIYRSVAYQHRDSGVEFIELPAQIDLSLVDYAETYGKVNLVTYSDLPGESKTITAKPIVYGITIPTNAEHFNEAVEFVKVVVGEKGQQVLTDLGQPPIVPARTNDISQIPEELKSLVVEI